MTGASFQEFFLLLVIGLVILGPKRLPQVANQIGSWLGQARRMTRMMKRQLEEEINLDLDSLRQIDVKRELGLSDAPKADVTRPAYVHDATRESSPGPAEPAVDELPDDYSPAHGAGEAGTGVGDDPDAVGNTSADASGPTIDAEDERVRGAYEPADSDEDRGGAASAVDESVAGTADANDGRSVPTASERKEKTA